MEAIMEQSLSRLPGPVAGSRTGERRRHIRHKLHTPVYASFNGPQTGMVVDLSELLDLHEEGFAVQTSQPLEVNRAVTLCLDLPETKSYIHGSGQVIWSDDTGRGGIRFSTLPESSRQILKQWLFANLLIACSNYAARTEQLTQREAEESSELAPPGKSHPAVPIPDRSGLLSGVEAVRREIHEIGDDVDAVLQLVTERALTLTGASGAALAFLTEDKMICRARAGEPAPPLGTPVNVKEGLSGECVRSAGTLRVYEVAKELGLSEHVVRQGLVNQEPRGLVEHLGKKTFLIRNSRDASGRELINKFRPAAYLSLETVLRESGISTQTPKILTCVTTGTVGEFRSKSFAIVYHRISPKVPRWRRSGR